MATIESSPLPPPGFRGPLTKLTEADRAKIVAQANDVIDFYLNGPGSFTPDGPPRYCSRCACLFWRAADLDEPVSASLPIAPAP